jgi:hypothetical protein
VTWFTAPRVRRPDPRVVHGENTMMTRLTALLVATALFGFFVGTRAIGGPALTAGTASAAGVREAHPLHGGFWRPAGSDATRPVVRLERAAWTPSASTATAARPATFAAVQAVVRLASLD